MAKKNLFEEDDENGQDVTQDQPLHPNETRLKINKPFAQQFEKRVQRQLIDKAKIKYGADYQEKMEFERAGGADDDESSDAQEDSEGELINEKVTDKFLTTLARIRTKDPSIYKSDKKFFKEKDFEEVISTQQKKGQSKMTYGDMIREDAMRRMNDENDDQSSEDDGTNKAIGETIADEQKRIRDEFKRAAMEIDGEEEEDVDGIFTQKKKSALQIENENKEYEKFIQRVAQKKEKKAKKNKDKNKDVDALKNFWGDANKLDETDKFLRKYIMTKGWVDRDDLEFNDEFEAADEQGEEEADRFEAKFNFRFEEQDANQVTTYGRQVEGSLRQKDSKRADQRKEREERKKEERKQLEEEIKQIKVATKGALLDRIQKIKQISGTNDLKANVAALLDEDFDDEKFTKQLEKQFDSDYYEEEDADIVELKTYEKKMKKLDKTEQEQQLEKFGLDEEDIKKHQKKIKKAADKIQKKSKEQGIEVENSSDWSSDDDDDEAHVVAAAKLQALEEEDKDNVLNVKSNIPLAIKKQLKDSEIVAMTEKDQNSEGMQLWWYCDNCKKGIPGGSNRFDCMECADYTLCKTCSDGQFHDHQLKKQPVPKNCVPPSDAEILQILQGFQVCKKCSIKLDEYSGYYKLDSNEEVVLCEECYDLGDYKMKSLYSFVEPKEVDLEELAERDPSKLKDHVTDEEVQRLVDQYYSLDFEDIISGGIKTRFKYIDVKPESYGLSDEQLLYADTDSLNKFVSIKKLAPYREDEGKVKSKQLKNKLYLQQVEKSTKINKKIVKQDVEKGLTTKEDLKLLKRKDKRKYLKQLEKEKQEKKSKKESAAEEQPKLVLEDLSRTERTNVSKNRLKSYGI